MRTLIFAVVAFLSLSFTTPIQSEKTLIAMFEGASDGVYYFVDDNNESYEFIIQDPKILSSYDLDNDQSLMDQKFKIGYRIIKDEDEIEDFVIVSLTLR